jgi:hypothetical protein
MLIRPTKVAAVSCHAVSPESIWAISEQALAFPTTAFCPQLAA